MLVEKRDILYKSLFFIFIISLAGGSYMLNFSLFGIDVYLFRIVLSLNIMLLFLNKDLVFYTSSFTKTIFYFLLFWIIYGIISFTWCEDITIAIHEVIYLVIGLLTYIYFVSINSYFNGSLNKYLLNNWLYGVIPTFIIAFFEINLGSHLEGNFLINLSKIPYMSDYDFVPFTTFDNPNNLAIYLALSLVFFIIMVRKYNQVFFFSILFCINSYLMIKTSSRIGVFFLEVLVFILIALNYQRLKSFFTKANIFKVTFATLLFSLLFIFYNFKSAHDNQSMKREKLKEEYHLKIKNKYVTNSYDSSSYNIRKNLILSGLDFASSSYFLGVGAGSFEVKVRKEENKYPTYGISNPHNYFIEVFSQYGILITLFIIILFLFMLIKVLPFILNYKYNDEPLFILLLILCFGLTSNSNSSFLPLPLNWFMFSLIIILFDKFYYKDRIKH